MTEMFTFREEVISQYSEDTYELFMEVFDCLPLAAKVANKYAAMHGGISPDIKSLDDINDLDRFDEIPLEGAMCDLTWSDPMSDKRAQ